MSFRFFFFFFASKPDDGKSEKSFIGNRGFRKRRDTPILIAARNGIIEMVERILQVFPMAILDKDPEGNNIVLLSVKNRQTKLYELLVNRKPRDQSAFNVIDVKGNCCFCQKCKSHIPHRLYSGFACFLKPIKGASFLMKYTHLSPSLKAICSITQLF